MRKKKPKKNEKKPKRHRFELVRVRCSMILHVWRLGEGQGFTENSCNIQSQHIWRGAWVSPVPTCGVAAGQTFACFHYPTELRCAGDREEEEEEEDEVQCRA